MAFLIAQDFRLGVDRRRRRVAGAPGSLWECINAHITRGGDIEKRKKFVKKWSLPSNCYGLKVVNGTAHVFGSDAAPSVPTGVTYHQLTKDTEDMTGVEDVALYDGKLYVVAAFGASTYYHFYDGTRVTAWDGGTSQPAHVATRLITFDSKLYAYGNSSFIYFCDIGDPTTWISTSTSGAGFINMATKESGSLEVIGAARYQTGLAFFSTDNIQTWTLDPDPAKNAVDRTLLASGAIAGRSCVTYGNNDTFYLSRSGIRSIQARMVGTVAPFVSDAGNAIDTLIQTAMQAAGTTKTSKAVGTIELVDGRYMLALDDKIYVLSYFPGSKITGWSWYEPTEITDFSADWVSVDEGKLYIRSGDDVYIYGGDTGTEYDSTAADMYPVTVGLPFLSGKRPSNKKTVNAYDVSAVNEWLVEALVDPRNEARKVVVGTLSEDTYPDQIHPASFDGNGFAMQFTCRKPGAATLTNFALDFDEDQDEAGP